MWWMWILDPPKSPMNQPVEREKSWIIVDHWIRTNRNISVARWRWGGVCWGGASYQSRIIDIDLSCNYLCCKSSRPHCGLLMLVWKLSPRYSRLKNQPAGGSNSLRIGNSKWCHHVGQRWMKWLWAELNSVRKTWKNNKREQESHRFAGVVLRHRRRVALGVRRQGSLY